MKIINWLITILCFFGVMIVVYLIFRHPWACVFSAILVSSGVHSELKKREKTETS